jgi:hypothetical protein
MKYLFFAALLLPELSLGFAPSASLSQRQSSFLNMARKTQTLEVVEETTASLFDPLNLASTNAAAVITVTSTALTLVGPAAAQAAVIMPKELTGSFDPKSFVPVCAASDNFYRVLQGTAEAVVGADNFKEYGPLIASGLLRVRLELCVVESFFNEAVGPFIRENGLSWVLPVHETVETFLAGTVFAVATTFILVGSTKILTVLFTYADFFVAAPMRLLGGFFFDRARGRPVTFDIGCKLLLVLYNLSEKDIESSLVFQIISCLISCLSFFLFYSTFSRPLQDTNYWPQGFGSG